MTGCVLLPAFIFFQRNKKIRKKSSPEVTKITVQIFALSLFPSLPFFLPGILPLQMQVCGSISSLPKETESFMNILHPVLEK